MTTIAFWNTKRGAAAYLLKNLCDEYAVDVLILAEETSSKKYLETILDGGASSRYVEFDPVPSRIRFFSKQSSGALSLVSDSGRASIRMYQAPGEEPIILGGVHLPSKLHADDSAQLMAATNLREMIEAAELQFNHSRSILIGDFNMNPFDPGMISCSGLHGVSTQSVAKRLERVVQEGTYKFFYNPMWSRLGDGSKGPAGSYFLWSSEPVSHFWNGLDQALIRPSLLDFYKDDNFHIVDQIGSTSLVDRDRVSKVASDHLPIILKLEA